MMTNLTALSKYDDYKINAICKITASACISHGMHGKIPVEYTYYTPLLALGQIPVWKAFTYIVPHAFQIMDGHRHNQSSFRNQSTAETFITLLDISMFRECNYTQSLSSTRYCNTCIIDQGSVISQAHPSMPRATLSYQARRHRSFSSVIMTLVTD
eukprot:scaffold30187_cov24-Prasinocladus_malaysianus.AAC.2